MNCAVVNIAAKHFLTPGDATALPRLSFRTVTKPVFFRSPASTLLTEYGLLKSQEADQLRTQPILTLSPLSQLPQHPEHTTASERSLRRANAMSILLSESSRLRVEFGCRRDPKILVPLGMPAKRRDVSLCVPRSSPWSRARCTYATLAAIELPFFCRGGPPLPLRTSSCSRKHTNPNSHSQDEAKHS